MKVYKEIKQIVEYYSKIRELIQKLDDIADGVEWETAEFVRLTNEDIERFKRIDGVTDDYYVEQHTGYFEDDFYGWLWFKTDVEGEYIKVHFSC